MQFQNFASVYSLLLAKQNLVELHVVRVWVNECGLALTLPFSIGYLIVPIPPVKIQHPIPAGQFRIFGIDMSPHKYPKSVLFRISHEGGLLICQRMVSTAEMRGNWRGWICKPGIRVLSLKG
jgi:hypothetical protein